MSGQFKNDGAERITNDETLIVRFELINLIGKKNIINTNLTDQHGNNNLLLPNFVKEKNDNGDIDIFLYYDLKITNPEIIINQLKENKNVLKINKNDKTWSFLFYSEKIKKKIQIDLHIVKNTPENLSNYFNYYRVPYLYFILGMILNKLDFKLGINGLFYTALDGDKKNYFQLERNYSSFLEKVFNIKIENSFNINSYKDIQNFLIKNNFANYDFFNLKEMRGDYLKKMKNNDKLAEIINGLPEPKYTIEDYKKELLIPKINFVYPYIEIKRKNILNQIEKQKLEKIKRIEKLELIFNKKIQDFSDNEKKLIPLLSDVLNEFIILKDINKKLKQKYNKNIYLVGGAVRDILMGRGNKDWDLTGNYTPEEFQNVIGGSITEKLGTVFFTTKEGLEIEYTPFRKESNYDGRKPGLVSFDTNIKGDSSRRDFTINSLYLNLDDISIIDYYNGMEDLKNLIIKAVGNPEERFEEDYLRILRGIRLAAKINGKIETETYKAMIKYCNNIKDLSDERVLEEFFKGFNIKENKKYINYLNDFGNDSNLFKNVLETYKKMSSKEIYSLIYYLVNGNIEKFKKIPGLYSGKTKKTFILIEQIKNNYFDLGKMKNEKGLVHFLYNLKLEQFSRKEVTKALSIFLNLKVLEGKINRNDIVEILNLKKIIDNKKLSYQNKHLRDKGFDIMEIIQKKGLKKEEIKNVLLDEIGKQFSNDDENFFSDNKELNYSSDILTNKGSISKKYGFPLFFNNDGLTDKIGLQIGKYKILVKGETNTLSFYEYNFLKNGKGKWNCIDKNIKPGKEFSKGIKNILLEINKENKSYFQLKKSLYEEILKKYSI